MPAATQTKLQNIGLQLDDLLLCPLASSRHGFAATHQRCNKKMQSCPAPPLPHPHTRSPRKQLPSRKPMQEPGSCTSTLTETMEQLNDSGPLEAAMERAQYLLLLVCFLQLSLEGSLQTGGDAAVLIQGAVLWKATITQ